MPVSRVATRPLLLFHTTTIKLTDASLEVIAAHCRGLESLTLQGCEQVSDQGLLTLLARCPNITVLNLRGVPDLTEVNTHTHTKMHAHTEL